VSSFALACIVFAVILAGSIGGLLLRNVLPAHHLVDDSKDLVRLGTGLIRTIGALVLGLLIASAETSYDTREIKLSSLLQMSSCWIGSWLNTARRQTRLAMSCAAASRR
jgi:hypothetical protein